MKKKTLTIVSSCAAIAVCSSLIVGSTYALFTSKDTVNIAVTAGKVNVTAEIGDLTVKSLNGYEETGKKEVALPNGGSASVTGNSVSLNGIMPGDSVKIPVSVTNNSTVSVKYRLTYEIPEGYLLASGLKVACGKDDLTGNKLYKSAWAILGDEEVNATVSIELPNHEDSAIDNIYQGLSTSILINVEAVQANGVIANGAAEYEALPDYSDLAEAVKDTDLVVVDNENVAELIKSGISNKYVVLSEDTVLPRELGSMENVVIDANGYEIGNTDVSKFRSWSGENVTVKNAVFNAQAGSADWSLWSRGVNYVNCEFNGYAPYIDSVDDILVDGCTFTNTTLQICFGETKNAEGVSNTTPNNTIVTNNVFNIDNSRDLDEAIAAEKGMPAHGLVFGYGQAEQWARPTQNNPLKNIVIEGNVFNPANIDKPYLACYIWATGTIGKLRDLSNNTYNGLAKYCVNDAKDAANYFWLNSATAQVDFNEPEMAKALLCPDCYNGNVATPHSEHGINEMLTIENGVATVNKEGAWLPLKNLEAGATYTLSYNVDLTNLTENSLVAFNNGETRGWADLQLGFTKAGDAYKAHNTLFVKQLATAKSVDIQGAQVSVKFVCKVVAEGSLEMTLMVNDTEFVSRAVAYSDWNNDVHGLCWTVYTYSAANGEAGLCSISDINVSVTK